MALDPLSHIKQGRVPEVMFQQDVVKAAVTTFLFRTVTPLMATSSTVTTFYLHLSF